MVLPTIISPCQSAFILGRSIGDNILMAQELFKNYHRNVGPPKFALKIDLKKAFDSIRWSFLLDVLQAFNFPPKFIFWIKQCITTATFSVKINGVLSGYFRSTKGLRQGDPLSPYLFVIVMEALSLMIKHSTSTSEAFSFHWKASCTSTTHLCFADDLILFCKGDLASVGIMKNSLDDFSQHSGLTINKEKSLCFLGNVPSQVADSIIDLLHFSIGHLPAKFLGVPLISSKLNVKDCAHLIEKITAKCRSWTNKFVSYGGRLQLIKSVLFSIQAYWTRFFILPKKVFTSIQSIVTKFLWKGSSLATHGVKVAWKDICCSFGEGGLGIMDLALWNQAQILLHLCNVLSKHSTSIWARWIKANMLQGKFFLDM